MNKGKEVSILKIHKSRKVRKIHKMASFARRVNSFARMDLSRSFKKLGLFGFRYVAGKFIMCHVCYLRNYNFLTNENPDIFHIKNSPECPVMRQLYGDEMCFSLISNYQSENDFKKFICKICYVRKIHYYNFPCMHGCICDLCSLTIRTCPYCKMRIRSFKKIYY